MDCCTTNGTTLTYSSMRSVQTQYGSPNSFASARCTCFEGWGADTDLTLYRAADCSARVCPAGKAWGDVPSGALSAHEEQECSSRYDTVLVLVRESRRVTYGVIFGRWFKVGTKSSPLSLGPWPQNERGALPAYSSCEQACKVCEKKREKQHKQTTEPPSGRYP